MNATELFLKDGRSSGVWYCEKCEHGHEHHVLVKEYFKPRICACGSECADGWILCNKCRSEDREAKERERFSKAEIVTEWDGPVYHPTLDIYARNISELLETHESETGYVWTCRSVPVIALDADAVVDDAASGAPEEYALSEVCGLTELRQAIEDFNNANRDLVYWEVDYTKALLVFEVKR